MLEKKDFGLFYRTFEVQGGASEVCCRSKKLRYLSFLVPGSTSEVVRGAFEVGVSISEVVRGAFEVQGGASEVVRGAFEVVRSASEVRKKK